MIGHQRYAILIVGLIAALLAASPMYADSQETNAVPKEKLYVYLLIGQSNMAGRAPFTTEESGAIQRCYLLNGEDKWEPARNPLNRYSTIRKGLGMQKMNPGYTFAKTMIEKDKDISIGLVVNAKGGTKVEQWAKGSKFHTEALKRTKVAQKSGTLMGILWHQGEGNSKDPKYLDKLKALIADIRQDLDEPNLPFIAGQINTAKCAQINALIAKLPAEVPFTGFASSDGLTTQDAAHFDPPSMKLLGQRYAEAMWKIQAKQKAEPKNPPDKK